jgi:sugar porter (SP) family MFS transporter
MEQTISKSRNSRFIYFICTVAAFGGLLFGYDWVVIGGAKPFYEVYFDIANDVSSQGLAMTMALIGCMIGATLCGKFAEVIGRKRLLIISSLIFFFSALATGAFNDFHAFLTARFFGGIGIGVASGLSPMYIAEVAPSRMRGRLVALNQMTIVIGILGAQITNWLIAEPIPSGVITPESWNAQMAWRWMFWAAAVPALAFFLLSLFIPESPRWLAMKGRTEEARDILGRIGGEQYATEEIQSIAESIAASSQAAGLKTLFTRKYAFVLVLGIFIAVFQQWSGTNVIFNYAQEVFQAAGYKVGDVLFNIVITGIANVIFTIIAVMKVDKWGRRTLMLVGAGGLCTIYALLGLGYYFHVTGMAMIVLVVAAIACYGMTLGPCTWVLISELFPNKVRSVGVATCTFALWVGSSTLTYTFPFLNKNLGSYGTFWIYALICGVGFIFFLLKLPETKGKSLEELERLLTGEK